MHVDQVGSLLSCCESIEPIFGVDEVIFPALLDPDYVFFESLILIIFCFFEYLMEGCLEIISKQLTFTKEN